MRVISLAERQQKTVSDVLRVEDAYLAFCLDEACDFVLSRIREGEQPAYEHKVSSMSEFYGKIGV